MFKKCWNYFWATEIIQQVSINNFRILGKAMVFFLSSKLQQKKKREEVSVAASLANSAAQDELNSRQGSHFNTPNESSDNNGDFTIHSAEEARRAIIWGEILQRKY